MKLLYLHGFATGPDIWPRELGGQRAKVLGARAEGLANEIKQSNEAVCLVGWSTGGILALQVASLFPDKLKALALVSTTPKFIKSLDFPHGLSIAILRKLQKKIKTEGIKAFHSLIFKQPDDIPGLANLSLEQAEKELKELEKVDLRTILPQIKLPTLIIHGDQDDICLPGAAAYLNKNLSQSKLVILPGVGHVPFLEAPELFQNALKDFIDGLPPE